MLKGMTRSNKGTLISFYKEIVQQSSHTKNNLDEEENEN